MLQVQMRLDQAEHSSTAWPGAASHASLQSRATTTQLPAHLMQVFWVCSGALVQRFAGNNSLGSILRAESNNGLATHSRILPHANDSFAQPFALDPATFGQRLTDSDGAGLKSFVETRRCSNCPRECGENPAPKTPCQSPVRGYTMMSLS